MIRYRPSSNHKRSRLGITECYLMTSLAPYGKPNFLGSRDSMVAKLKLKGIDGRAPSGVEPATYFDSTRKTHQVQTIRIDRLRTLSGFYGCWCMAVLSWWSDLSG